VAVNINNNDKGNNMEGKAYTLAEKREMIKQESKLIYDQHGEDLEYSEEMCSLFANFIMNELPTKKEAV
jgi:hypothetical protein